MATPRVSASAALGLILAIALALRLLHVGFGLPSMYDPDEPFFILKAYEMIDGQTLNPRWFGHPGTTTLYLVMVVEVSVVIVGLLIGQWSTIDQFATAVYSNPGVLFIPARVSMVLTAVACIWLTYAAGQRLLGKAEALLGAALLALNGLHIAWSQVVRTDIQASLFMMACLFFAARAADEGKMRDFLLGGMMVGLSAATKWPALSVAIALFGAATCRLAQHDGLRPVSVRLAASAIASLASLLAVSPFLVLDWRTAVSDMLNEGKPMHLGHTGDGPLSNLIFYLHGQVVGTMGWLGLVAIVFGTVAAIRSRSVARWTLIPATVAYFCLLAMQNLVWSRWVLPLLPMLALLAGHGMLSLGRALDGRRISPLRRWALPTAAIALLIPSAVGAWGAVQERKNDTRDQSADWAVRHFPTGSRVVIEHLQIGLRNQPWTVLFPMGEAGCLNGKQLLSRKVRNDEVQSVRKDAKIIDLGNVAPGQLASCRADFAILSYYDLYLAERSRYPVQLAAYDRILSGGRTVAVFRPKAGEIGGPVIRIVAMRPTGRVN